MTVMNTNEFRKNTYRKLFSRYLVFYILFHTMYQKTIDSFKEIAKIPRCSKYEEKVREWLIGRARKQGYTYKTDVIGNVVIFVDASEGRENEEILVLQGHMDMVCVKEQGSEHDFSRDALQVVACDRDGVLDENGTWIKAL